MGFSVQAGLRWINQEPRRSVDIRKNFAIFESHPGPTRPAPMPRDSLTRPDRAKSAMELGPTPSPRLLDQVHAAIHVRHLSPATDAVYTRWIRSFILFHGKRHPREMGASEVEAYLSHLAIRGKVAPSTQNQAKAALLFLYKVVLGRELPWLNDGVQAKTTPRLPVVLSTSVLFSKCRTGETFQPCSISFSVSKDGRPAVGCWGILDTGEIRVDIGA